ncbi:T9SS type A sorting domain-containing protein [Aurantibacillus circumpalustris]|uniref:T9SS type A sorting domain-containing protein n=1 Tax=Aurantibacillus circumpalustris TaxID=3036359 RepID=UPI00295C1789|nr:T9SS type A sorting domain-containing protein [Aurantibacillus circumpalustris]
MKKQLLSIFAALTLSTTFAQVPAAAWSTNQNAIFPTSVLNSGVKFMDAVDANVIWVIGKDYGNTGFSRNYNWYSRSINGGALFAGGNVYSDTNTFIIANLEGIDANTAWVSAYMKGVQGMGAIHRTINGGANWVNMSAPGMFTNTAAFANWVTFLTPSVGIANGDPVNGEFELWRTTDGGLTWAMTPGANIPNPNSGEFAIVNLYAKVGSSNLWFGTNSNRIFHSVDAGISYSVTGIGPVTNTITEIAFSSPLNGVVYMVNSGATLELWNTYDGGQNWAQISPLSANLGPTDVVPVPGTGNLVSFNANSTTGFISYSNDNGLSWTDFGSTGIAYITGDFVNGTTGWAGGLDVPQNPTPITDIWKFSGALSGTVSPSAAFALPATLCLSGTSTVIPVNTSIGSPALSYSWSVLPAGATLSSPTASAPTITFNTAGTYSVILTATNTVGSNITTWVVNVTACTAPVATFTLPTSACTGFSFSPGNTSTGAPAPGYLWSVSPSNNVTLTPASGLTPDIQIGSPGIYSVTLFVSNPSGTTQTTQTVSVIPCLPIADFDMPEVLCAPIKTFATSSSVSNPSGATGSSFTYTWSFSPASGVSPLPGYYSANLTKVTISGTISTYTVTMKVKNPSGVTSVTKVITLSPCTGINEGANLSENLIIFPNPAHEQVNIVVPPSNENYKVKLTNLLGSVVYEDKSYKSSQEVTTINLAGKAKGVYFLTVESNNERVTKKIVIE